MKSLLNHISNKIFESKKDLTRFKIEDLHQELIDNKVSKTRINEIKKFFNDVLGNGPYYCISSNNEEGKKELKFWSDLKPLTLLNYPEDHTEITTNEYFEHYFIEIETGKYINSHEIGERIIDKSKYRVFSKFGRLYLFGEWEGKRINGTDKYYEIFNDCVKEIIQSDEEIAEIANRMEKYSKEEIFKSKKSELDKKYQEAWQKIKNENDKKDAHNKELFELSQELIDKFNKIKSDSLSLKVSNFKFGYSGIPTRLTVGIAKYNNDFIPVIIQVAEPRGAQSWIKYGGITYTYYVASKDID